MNHKPEVKEINLEEYFKLPNSGLFSYFGKVRVGSDKEYRTNFGGQDVPVEKVLDEWMPHLQGLADSWPTLWDFEMDLAKKVGPLSIQKPLKDRMDDIYSYYTSIFLDAVPVSDSAKRAFKAEWKSSNRLDLESPRRTVDNMKLSTNSGSPYFTRRSRVADRSLETHVAYPHGTSLTRPILVNSSEIWRACAVLGWRGQEGGPSNDDVKQRVVWMFPFSVNIEELRVYQPLIRYAQIHNLVPAWVGMDAVDAAITKLFDTKDPKDLVVCTDFTKFDQHFNPTLQTCAQELLYDLFKPNVKFKRWLLDVFPVKYNIPMMIQPGKVLFGKHGMGSGSGGTNADETIVHRTLQHEAALSAGSTLNLNSMCLGDDGILSYPGITVEQVTKSYSAHGLDMNIDKQYASTDDCVYLRRWHHNNYRVNDVCVGVYSTCRALGRLCEQERFYDPKVWSEKAVALRQLSILENCKYHPLKEEFVEFCIERDKYRLGIDIPGFLDNITAHAWEAIEQMPDFLGYTKSMSGNPYDGFGIDSWWIVNYLRNR